MDLLKQDQNRAKGARPRFAGLPPCTRIQFGKELLVMFLNEFCSFSGSYFYHFEATSSRQLESYPTLQNSHFEAANHFFSNDSTSPKFTFAVALVSRLELRKICGSFFKSAFNVFEPIELAFAAAGSKFSIARLSKSIASLGVPDLLRDSEAKLLL